MNKIRTLILSGLLALPLAITLPVVVVAPAALIGCANLHGDPVVIRAEQAIKIGFELCDAFVTFEHLNNSNGELGQAFRKAADDVRRQAPTWIRWANVMLDNYQAAMAVFKTATDSEKASAADRVTAAQAALDEALRTLQAGQDEAARQLAAAQKAR